MFNLVTQALKPGFKFRLSSSSFFFLVQSQIALWSLTRMRHLGMRTAHGICRSCRREKLARMAVKSFPNEQTVRDRPTLKDVKRFRNGYSPSITRDQFFS